MLIKSKKVWLSGQFLPLIVEITNDKITAIYDYDDEKEVDYDFGSNRVLPGFIDIHTHGAYGFDTNDANEDGLRRWAKNVSEEGVTAFLPTTITQTEETLLKAVSNVAKVHNDGYEGSEILGIHFEGPYLDVEKRGAQPLDCLQKPDVEQFKKFQEASNNLIKVITIASDLDPDYKLTKYLASEGIKVSMGHSSANYKETALAFANGAISQTHVFNGMTGFHHRDPGQVGYAFFSNDSFGEVIADGIHSTPESLNLFFQTKGRDKAIVISDSINAKGLGSGTYEFGGENVIVHDDGRATREDGRLAGSTANIINSLRVLIEDALVPVNYAINACTKNPADLLGLSDSKGRIKVGYDADITVISDDYKVIKTFGKGKIIYEQ
ncbi:N-acetylglucosamine-6-phosphate deacetylase [Gemelliphila palaticanis]|uniref:N-acetylglucosamine-6-phosphate deacetylase n=1 Tax=Gemelliphila palaticanis TaxID=81950 RepID=A0ABX2SYJ2_9BACL|nr:N-acetylglucosamine-6-phosphate deacetylase [Gemella palaticanis]MBF0715365.1 N-acetylglucosamine-6-phosphate deacetylase [Gemella palaticanis]NYS47295.1 N-acetylglucosamine-6-phosphate deacetylase [Gemella palaticanis]